ncbi:hypothetical protein AGMMS50267_11590 [Spirochaetia bacterium]|nr:hypothetical protein AGMMS50267_11590 [Spirochaetia bacterium]
MANAFVKDYKKYYGYDHFPKSTPNSIKGYIQFLNEIITFYHLCGGLKYTMPIEEIKKAAKEYGVIMPSQCIIGEVELVDIVSNSKNVFAEPGCLHWIFDKAVLYEKPVMNVMGKLQLWEYVGLGVFVGQAATAAQRKLYVETVRKTLPCKILPSFHALKLL